MNIYTKSTVKVVKVLILKTSFHAHYTPESFYFIK